MIFSLFSFGPQLLAEEIASQKKCRHNRADGSGRKDDRAMIKKMQRKSASEVNED